MKILFWFFFFSDIRCPEVSQPPTERTGITQSLVFENDCAPVLTSSRARNYDLRGGDSDDCSGALMPLAAFLVDSSKTFLVESSKREDSIIHVCPLCFNEVHGFEQMTLSRFKGVLLAFFTVLT